LFASAAAQKAWLAKENILRYQRESAIKRTVVYDDQADHFGSEKSQWLSIEEKTKVEENQEAAHEQLHQRRHNLHVL
jgi:hypothetical protein